jgi:hypothetical protein
MMPQIAVARTSVETDVLPLHLRVAATRKQLEELPVQRSPALKYGRGELPKSRLRMTPGTGRRTT